jgi:hypothetical protein
LAAVDKDGAALLLGCFDETYSGVDNILVDYVLNSGLRPVESKEGSALYLSIVLAMLSCAVYYMCDLIDF